MGRRTAADDDSRLWNKSADAAQAGGGRDAAAGRLAGAGALLLERRGGHGRCAIPGRGLHQVGKVSCLCIHGM